MMEKYEMRFFYEYGCHEGFIPCLWSKNELTKETFGYCVNVYDLSLSNELINLLYLLGEQHDDMLDWNSGEDLSTNESRNDFLTKSKYAFSLLQKELGHKCDIEYCIV